MRPAIVFLDRSGFVTREVVYGFSDRNCSGTVGICRGANRPGLLGALDDRPILKLLTYLLN